ncbi:6210_t:CDS:10 [Entrophospora sp. SA101]|nr:6210_t:CDS:10 [Entrophospora sp. SA101]
MIDFIFGVRYPQHWHSLNLMQHRDHYSFMGSLGSGAISTLQENFGPGVYFNPYVNVDGMLIKYGVVSIDKLCKDLLDWETLYLAGRMHKPIKILRDDARVHLAQQVNLISALRTALLLLPKDFTEEQLYLTIASLSYKGDFRRYFGENPNKLKNIVLNQMHDFNLLYSGLINGLPNVEFITDGKLQQDDSPKAQIQLIKKLPRLLSHKIQEEHRMVLAKHGQQWPSDINDVYKSIINSGNYGEYIETKIVFRSAITQSLKGILTAGLKKSEQLRQLPEIQLIEKDTHVTTFEIIANFIKENYDNYYDNGDYTLRNENHKKFGGHARFEDLLQLKYLIPLELAMHRIVLKEHKASRNKNAVVNMLFDSKVSEALTCDVSSASLAKNTKADFSTLVVAWTFCTWCRYNFSFNNSNLSK